MASALPIPASTSQPPPRGANWITLETASERSGLSIGHIRRACGCKWQGMGLARLEQPGDGRRSIWFVHQDAHPAFALVKFADQLTREFDLRTVPERTRRKATERQRIVDLWQADLCAGRRAGLAEKIVTQRFVDRMAIEENRALSRPTLFNWARAARDGIEGLINVYGAERAASPLPPRPDPFLDAVKWYWLRESRPKLKTCYDHAKVEADAQGWKVCSFKTIERKIKTIPEQLVIQKRMGVTAFANHVLPPARRDYSSIDSNSWWCSDHHQFDVVVTHKGKHCRPWISCWEDLRSREIVGWHIFAHDPNQSTILLSLRAGMLAEGLPETVLIDNGRDYDSYTLQGLTKKQRRKIKVEIDMPAVGGVLGALKIKVVHAIPLNAKAKPIERFFGTVCTRFSKFFPTYCGRNPQEKPQSLPEQLARGNAPTLEDFSDRFAAWLDCDYHARVHEGDSMDGLCPSAAFDKFLVRRRVASADKLQLLIQKTSMPLIAGREGVCWNGIRYGRGDACLFPYFCKKVFLRVDPSDVTIAAAYSIDDVWIGDLNASADMPLGANDEEHRRAGREKQTIRELTNKYFDLGSRRTADIMELMMMNRASDAAAANPPPADPPSLLLARTSLDGQSIPLRKTWGTEGMSPRSSGKPKLIDMVSVAEELDRDEPKHRTLSMARFFDEGD